MMCDTCGSDDFAVIRTKPGLKFVDGNWKTSQKIVTREIVCNGCNTRYLSEESIVAKYVYVPANLRSKIVSLVKDKNQSSLFNE